jgi:predicted nucleic acid-binding protein
MNDALLDVNVLIACVVENHADHQRAHRFLSTLERFRTTPTTHPRRFPALPDSAVERRA